MRRYSGRVLILALSIFSILCAAAAAEIIKLRVTAEQANIREKPDIMSAILEQLPEGSVIEAERKEGEWFAVLVKTAEGGAVTGYVHESLVQVIEEEPAKQEMKPEPQAERKPAAEKEEKPVEERVQAPPVFPPEEREEGRSISLWFGGRYAAIGDLNDGASGAVRYFQEVNLAGAEPSGGAKPLHFGRLFGLELRLPLRYGFSVALGGEYFSGERAGEITFGTGISSSVVETRPRVSAVPLSISLLYFPGPHLYLRAGLEYTFARCRYLYRLEQPLSWREEEGYADAGAFGYLLGVGTEWRLLSGFSFVAEALFRHARLSGFDGVNIERASTGYGSTKKGTLYYFEVRPSAAGTFPLVYVREQKPADAAVITAREAVLNLTGLSLKFGFRFRF